jgi:hypothetical protein
MPRKKTMPYVCIFDPCEKPAVTKSLCSGHYAQLQKGKELTEIRDWEQRYCIGPECDRKVTARDLCNSHYRQWNEGRPLTVLRPHRTDFAPCAYEPCDRRAFANGWCAAHNSQMKSRGYLSEIQPRSKEPQWRTTQDGYVTKHVKQDGKTVVLSQHRVVMEEYLGRPLRDRENVHHRNGVRSDNRIENLELWISHQPSGQRVIDQLEWAHSIIETYGAEEDKLRLVLSSDEKTYTINRKAG